MHRRADPPVLMRDVIADLDDVTRLLESQAPYTPLGGWYNPGADPDACTRPMWFQNDWVHDTFAAEGSVLFLRHQGYIDAAKRFYGAEVVEPKSVYVNLMVAIAEGGPAHTDNPRFHGRDRTNTPMWLLRTMLWSGLFDRYAIAQATAIWWMNDVEGGGLLYWADGPDHPPSTHAGAMANTALIGDNHGMFHQVGPVGPFDEGTRRITPSATLAPIGDGSGDWAVSDHGRLRLPRAARDVSGQRAVEGRRVPRRGGARTADGRHACRCKTSPMCSTRTSRHEPRCPVRPGTARRSDPPGIARGTRTPKQSRSTRSRRCSNPSEPGSDERGLSALSDRSRVWFVEQTVPARGGRDERVGRPAGSGAATRGAPGTCTVVRARGALPAGGGLHQRGGAVQRARQGSGPRR